MRVKEFKRERTIYDVFYQTSDGELFTKKEDAERHEKTYECVIKTMFKKIPHSTTNPYSWMDYGNDYDCIYVMRPRDLNDIKIINEYWMDINCDTSHSILDSSTIGKPILLMEGECHDWLQYLGTVENYTKSITEHINMKIEEMGDKTNAE